MKSPLMIANPAINDGPEPVLLTGLILAASIPASLPSQRSGYPKLFRCPSVVERPLARPDISSGCRDWRRQELARIDALPRADRIARVEALRARIGVAPNEGLRVTADGRTYDAAGGRIDAR